MKKLLILIGLTMATVPAFATSQNNGVSYKANEEDVDSAVWPTWIFVYVNGIYFH
jgi:hypothetical protein